MKMSNNRFAEKNDLITAAKAGGDYWNFSDGYYEEAEDEMDNRWEHLLSPFLRDFDFTTCVDLAAGHGRNTRKLLEQPACGLVYCVDINQVNTDFCRRRFRSNPKVRVIKNNGFIIPEIESGSITCFYCFDAMVHFDSDVVRSYLREVKRTLCPSIGKAFLHHSNLGSFPCESPYNNSLNPASRNFMSASMFTHYAHKEGLSVISQQEIDWLSNGTYIDAFSILSVS